MALEESNKDDEPVTEIDGVKFLIKQNQTSYFNNTKLDFTKNLFGHEEFKVLRV